MIHPEVLLAINFIYLSDLSLIKKSCSSRLLNSYLLR